MDRNTQIAKLKEEIAAGRVVTIAGTGVSITACGNQEVEGFRVATWTGLLQHGVKHLKDIGAANDKAARSARDADRKRGDRSYHYGSRHHFTAHEGEERRHFSRLAQGHHRQAENQRSRRCRCTRRVARCARHTELRQPSRKCDRQTAVTWLKTDDVQDVLTRVDTDAMLHLHGWFKEPESVVLGLSSYLAVKDHPHAKAVLNLFTIDRTLLFVGCGDTVLDPNFTQLIEWAKEALSDVAPRHYLLCRISEVADFQKKLAGAPWLQPLGYGADYGDLMPFLRSLAPAGGVTAARPSRAPARASFDLAAYQQAMRKRYARLKLEELDPTTHDVRPLTLTGMFIAQNARECAEFMPRVFELPKELQRRLREHGEMEGDELDEELLAQHRRAYLDQLPRPILEIVRDPAFRRLVILGDPGSGKSTLLQFLLLDWAEKAAPDPAGEPLPLLIELREYARLRHEGKVEGFLGYLHEGASVRWHLDRAQLDAWLKNNPSRVLFDGLDEVFDPALRKEVSTAIHRFADEYPPARIIVTSRIIGYQHQTWRDEDFRHFMLQELDEEQIVDFLVRWHRAAYEEASKGETKRALLADAIEHSTAIRQLAGNPLLLTMMAILNRTQDLPRDRAELYEQCARLLLHQWKVDVAFAPDPELSKASLDYKDKRGLLLHVARAMQSSERGLAGNLIDEATLEDTLAGGLKGVPNLRPNRAARALIEQLRGRNFMLCSIGGRSYAFVHRTFLEYFCAVEIRERFQTEQSLSLDQLKTEIFGHWADETWHEVLTLLAGMLAPKFLREILEWLLARPDPDDVCHHVFLAARCIGEMRRREELAGVEKQVLERARALTRFDLSRYYEPGEDEAMTVTSIRTRAVEMVAMVWRETADTRAWLKARAQSDADDDVRTSAVQELARGWKDDPETLPMLKAWAQSDEDDDVRASAVQELARGWKDDPETLSILKALAQSDEHWALRQRAVQELARGWKDDPETLSILKALVQSNEYWPVRMSAVQELARSWKDKSETLPMLKVLVQRDEHWAMRTTGVQELARGWKDDPETLPILKARAQSDEDAYVRQSAVQELMLGWKDDSAVQRFLKTINNDW